MAHVAGTGTAPGASESSWNPFDWWSDALEAALRIPQDVAGYATGWLTGLGGKIASGLEGGIVALIGDVWDVIIGPVLVILGAVIIILTLAFAFRHQIIQLGGLAVRAAA